MAARRAKYDHHVRIYEWEMRTPAWQTLDPDARALLIEMRSLYTGRTNAVHMSVREVMRRLSIGQRRAQAALAALIDRGWIRVIETGSFCRKVRHATVYALESEPLTDHEGAVAPKSYMRWQPPRNTPADHHEFSSVVVSATDGSRDDYRDAAPGGEMGADGSQHGYRRPKNPRPTVAVAATQVVCHGGTG